MQVSLDTYLADLTLKKIKGVSLALKKVKR